VLPTARPDNLSNRRRVSRPLGKVNLCKVTLISIHTLINKLKYTLIINKLKYPKGRDDGKRKSPFVKRGITTTVRIL
jgi:hypothetical protein